MDETKIPTRDEIPETDKWDLTHSFSNAEKWNEDFAWLQSNLSAANDMERASWRIAANAGRGARI